MPCPTEDDQFHIHFIEVNISNQYETLGVNCRAAECYIILMLRKPHEYVDFQLSNMKIRVYLFCVALGRIAFM